MKITNPHRFYPYLLFLLWTCCYYSCVLSKPLDRKQSLVNRLIDMIKREHIKLNLVEVKKTKKGLESTPLANEEEILAEVDQLFDKNTLEDMENAINIVNDTLKHEPIFKKEGLAQRQDSDVEDEEEDNTLEDIVVGVYTALPEDVQESVAEGYEYMVEGYQNLTNKLKREWYNFQVGTNEFLTEIFGEDEEEEPVRNSYQQIKDKNDVQTLRPGESTVTFWDVVGEWFEDFFTGFWGTESEKKRNSGSPQSTNSNNGNFWTNLWHKSNIRIYKRSLRKFKEIRQRSKILQKVVSRTNNYQKITKRDIILPSFGTAGDIVNDLANTLINTATVWKYQSEGPECTQRLLCQSNNEIFGRGHVLPSVMTYLSNLIISIIAEADVKPSEILLAAQRGRKGNVDCLQIYPRCKLKL